MRTMRIIVNTSTFVHAPNFLNGFLTFLIGPGTKKYQKQKYTMTRDYIMIRNTLTSPSNCFINFFI